MKAGDVIFLSASVPYRGGWREDARPADIEEAIVSVSRAVFSRGGRLLFGGHPSVSPLIASIAGEYYPADPERRHRPVITFQSEFFRGRLPDETWDLYRMGWSSIIWTPEVPDNQPDSLKLMREAMLRHPETPPKAMIAVGGMEGIFEEAEMFLEFREKWDVNPLPPVCAIESGGGAARKLAGDGRVTGLERDWWDANPDALPRGIPFQPFAAMAQWFVDKL